MPCAVLWWAAVLMLSSASCWVCRLWVSCHVCCEVFVTSGHGKSQGGLRVFAEVREWWCWQQFCRGQFKEAGWPAWAAEGNTQPCPASGRGHWVAGAGWARWSCRLWGSWLLPRALFLPPPPEILLSGHPSVENRHWSALEQLLFH